MHNPLELAERHGATFVRTTTITLCQPFLPALETRQMIARRHVDLRVDEITTQVVSRCCRLSYACIGSLCRSTLAMNLTCRHSRHKLHSLRSPSREPSRL